LTVSPDQIFIDDGISGAKLDRPALNRMNRMIEARAISLVIVYKLDRLARKPYIAYRLIEEWRGKAGLVSVTESHIDTTSTVGQLGFGIATVFADHERNMIRDRTMSGKRRRAAEGRNPGLRPCYGYEIVDKSFVIVEDEAAIVRRIFDEYVSKGRTDGQLARLLGDSGIRTKAGGPWHISAVQRVLQNPAYVGTLVYGDITAADAFPVIVEPSMWVQAQSIRTQKAKNHPRRMASESPYILSGRLTCSKCGRPMNGRLCRNGTYENRYYACTGYLQFRDCDCLTVRQEKIEEAVLAELVPLLDENELNRRLTARVGTTIDQLNQEVSGLESRLREIDQQFARVRQDYRQALIDAQTFNELRAEIEADRASLSSTLSAKKSELISAETSSRLGEEARQAVNLLRAWAGITLAQRKQVIHLLTESVEFDYQTDTVKVSTAV
jgi:site-specific DNA recombinase